MVELRIGARRRLLVVAVLFSASLTVVGQSPASADVTAVGGSAFGYYVNVGLFGGPPAKRGHGQVLCTSVPPPPAAPQPPGCVTPQSSLAGSASPSVTLPSSGPRTITAVDPDGAKGQYGPAVIFGGIWPESASSAPPSGPITVSTAGSTGPGGSVTSSADIVLYSPPNPNAPGGIGPGPLIADEAHSTCTADESGVTGSATFVNGILETKYDTQTQAPIESEPIPVNPPPNYTRSGTIDHVGDRFKIVFNEQIIGPDSITVNAAHMYLLGEVARGDMVVGSSTCSLSSTVPNAAPVATDDAYSTGEDKPLTVPAAGMLSNDADPDGDPLTATAAQAVFLPGPDHPAKSVGNDYDFPSAPEHGTASFNPDGSFTYTPGPNFSGTDSFEYVARDARGANDTAVVTITVTPNRRPVAVDDAYSTGMGQLLSVPAPGVLGNDADPDGDTPLTAGGATDPPKGVVSLEPDGSFTYVPDDPLFVGTDTFSYTVTDPDGATDTGIVSISVGGISIPTTTTTSTTTTSTTSTTSTTTTLPATTTTTVPPSTRHPIADFDDDGDSDVSVFRPSSGAWYRQGSPDAAWGTTGDIPVPADYDGDGDSEVAVFRPADGVWYIQGGDSAAWGTDGDVPVPADYDGDAKTDLAVYRAGVWYVSTSGPGPDLTTAWGTTGDVPVPADYDGDGDAEVGVFRPSQGVWYIQGGATTAWGTNGDVPVPADYDGDAKTDLAVFRAGVWYVATSGPGPDLTTGWGTTGDIPVPADYSGDGVAEVGVFRPGNGVWFVQNGPTLAWGTNGDRPLTLPAAIYRSMGA